MPGEPNLSQKLKELYGLTRLPVEGGYFAQTYRSTESSAGRPLGSAIFYLLDTDPDCFSALHRLPTDEIYHFYLGDPVETLLLYPDGRTERVILGPDVFAGQRVQFVAPADVWQGSHLCEGGRCALLGTTMAPGYIDSDYTGGERADLVSQYPDEAALIRRLTRG
jgi:predicted cupin superfamily sugar epimerase